MVIYLPCKLGESFERLKFRAWENSKHVYEPAGMEVLKGVHVFDCMTRCLALPTIVTKTGKLLSYDPSGDYSQEFIPRFKLMLDAKSVFKPGLKGFPGGRSVRLGGLILNDEGAVCADLVTVDRHEHLLYPIKEELIHYYLPDELISESRIEYEKCSPFMSEGVASDAGVEVDMTAAVMEQCTLDSFLASQGEMF